MDVLDNFSKITALICEPVRSKILWSLLDGKAYTATELAAFANVSTTSASNHLSKLLDADLLKVETQGRHRYFTFSNTDVAYAVEALAQLSKVNSDVKTAKPTGIKYCRTCYDHLAGYVGVQFVEAMETQGFLVKDEKHYLVTEMGWEWLRNFDIQQTDYATIRRPLTRQCLDWSERRSHLAGQLGADLLKFMIENKWLKRVEFSRELVVTVKGRQEIFNVLRISFQ